MREITDIALIDRTTRRVRYSDGKQEYHCRGPQNTIAYYDGSGVLRPQDITMGEETYTKSVNGLWLKRQNQVSVGVRMDGVLAKYMGMRPDVCQDGSEQLEFSIENVTVNDKSVTIKLPSAATRVTSLLDNYGDYISVYPYRQGCRQFVKADGNTKSISITYRLHLTGLELVSNDLGEFWFASKKTGEVRFRFRKPVLCDIGTLQPIFVGEVSTSTLLKHSLSIMQPDGTYLYTKESIVDLSLLKLPPEYYLDADTVYSGTEDGQAYASNADWTTVHDATTGNVNATVADSGNCCSSYYASSKIYIIRAYLVFSLAGLSGTLSSCSVNLYGSWNGESTVGVMQGTQSDTLVGNDFDAFSGSVWGTSGPWSTSSYNAISFNSTGLTAAQNALGGTFKVCCRESSHDIANSSCGTSNYRCGMHFADETGTDKDPYFSLTKPAKGNPFYFQMLRRR